MSQKITRRDLKRNELAETMGRTVGYVSEHRRGVTEAVAIAAGVAVLVGGFFVYRAWSARSAGKALSEALSVLDTPLASEPDAAGAPKTYPNDAERRKDANELLEKAATHGSTSPGRAAQVLLAADGADKPGQTVDVFEKAARQGRSETAAAAEIDAAKLLASQGKATEAIERLKRAIDSPNGPAPEGRAALHAGPDLRPERRRRRRARDLPAADHRVSELAVPRRRPAEGPAVVALLHVLLAGAAALAVISLIGLAAALLVTPRLSRVRGAAPAAGAPRLRRRARAQRGVGRRGGRPLSPRPGLPGLRGDRGRRPLDGLDRARSSGALAADGPPAPRRARRGASVGLAGQAARAPPGRLARVRRDPLPRRRRRAL